MVITKYIGLECMGSEKYLESNKCFIELLCTPCVSIVTCDTPVFQVCRHWTRRQSWTQRPSFWALQTVFSTSIKQTFPPGFSITLNDPSVKSACFSKGIQMLCELHHFFLRDDLSIRREAQSSQHLQGTSSTSCPYYWPL